MIDFRTVRGSNAPASPLGGTDDAEQTSTRPQRGGAGLRWSWGPMSIATQ